VQASFPSKLSNFRKRVREAVASKEALVGVSIKVSQVM
jgi:hypothetical protein